MTQASAIKTELELGSRYELFEKLGAGGEGEVWRAYDKERGVDVALKVPSVPAARSDDAFVALRREYEMTQRLDHPGILTVFPPERFGSKSLLPMELAAGGDASRLRGASYFDIVPVLLEIARALEHAHSRDVVHRDLKPGNILFDGAGAVKIADFGVSGAVSVDTDFAHRGLSPFYASPEQLRNEPPKVADDIYGFGALAYELLSGDPPNFPHFDARRAMSEPVPKLVPIRQIPTALERLVIRMLAKPAAQRPASMREVIDELEALLHLTLPFDAYSSVTAPLAPASTSRSSSASPRVASVVAASHVATASRNTSNVVNRSNSDAPTSSNTVAASGLGKNAPKRNVSLIGAATTPQTAPVPAPPRRELPAAGPVAVADITATELTAEPSPRPAVVPAVKPTVSQAPTVPETTTPPPLTASRHVPLELAHQIEVVHWHSSVAPEITLTAAPVTETLIEQADGQGVHPLWRQLQLPEVPRTSRLEPIRGVRWHWVALGTLIGLGFLAVYALSLFAPGVMPSLVARLQRADPVSVVATPASASTVTSPAQAAAQVQPSADGTPSRLFPVPERANADGSASARLASARTSFDRRVRALERRGAQTWGGAEFINARMLSAESVGAHDAGDEALALTRLNDAGRMLEKVEQKAPRVLASGESAPAAAPSESAQAATATSEIAPAAQPQPAPPSAARQKAAAYEAQERWEDAIREYDSALKNDPSLQYAQLGKARAGERADLANRLQALLDNPEQLAQTATRDQARSLLETARSETVSGPVLRSQIARLEILLPQYDDPRYDKPVPLAVFSDNATQVAIPSIGAFGTFRYRNIDLKPGRYTVIGTRAGYHEVRRDITVEPGQTAQTVSVTCSDPI